MSFDVTEISTLIVKLVFVSISVFVIPYIKNKLGENKFNEALKWVKIAVTAAEQLYDSCDGEAKKQYVLSYLNGKGFKIDPETLDNMIESCVLELHKELYGASK